MRHSSPGPGSGWSNIMCSEDVCVRCGCCRRWEGGWVMPDALWLLLPLALLGGVALLVYRRGWIRMRLKAVPPWLELEGARRDERPAEGGIAAKRLDAGGTIEAHGHSIHLGRGQAGGDINLRTAAGAGREADQGWASGSDGVGQSIDMGGARAESINIDQRSEQHFHDATDRAEALHQLPGDPAVFTGREAELARLREVLNESGRPAVITGLPGVGKSALAIHLAHQLADEFSDGQLYVDLHGWTDERSPPDAGEVLAGLLVDTFRVDSSEIPLHVDDRARLYRARLHGRRVVVVLDNAATEAQVRPLLPPEGGAAVITSRSRLGGLEAASVQELAGLEGTDAVALLARVAGRPELAQEPASGDLVEHCGYLPLAVCIAGGRLKAKPHWTVDHLAQRFDDERRRLDELEAGDRAVRASLNLSYRELAGPVARTFRLLGLIPGTEFTLEAVAATVGCDPQEAEDHLETLVDSHLVEASRPGRYRLHELVRLFARDVAQKTPVEAEAATERAVAWYLVMAEGATRLLEGQTSSRIASRADALNWLEAERANLVAAVNEAHEAGLWEATVRLTNALADFFVLRSHWADWQATHETALDAARRSGEREHVAGTLINLATVHRQQGRLEEAGRCLDECLTIREEMSDRRGDALTWVNLGLLRAEQGRWDEAIGCLQDGLGLCQESGDRHGEAKVLTNLGNLYRQQGRLDEAIRSLEESLTIEQELDDPAGKARSLTNLGDVYEQQGRRDDAFDLFEEGLGLLEEVGDRDGQVQVLNNLGILRTEQGRWGDAIPLLEDALGISVELGERQGQGKALTNLATVYRQQGRFEDARGCLEQSLSIDQDRGDRQGQAVDLGSIGLLHAKQGQWDDALSYYETSLGIFRDLGDPQGEAVTLGNIAEVYERPDDAVSYYEASLSIVRAVGARPTEGVVLNNLGNLHRKQGNWNRAVPLLEESVTINRELGDHRSEALALTNLGNAYEGQGRRSDAVSAAQRALSLYDQVGDHTRAAEIATALQAPPWTSEN